MRVQVLPTAYTVGVLAVFQERLGRVTCVAASLDFIVLFLVLGESERCVACARQSLCAQTSEHLQENAFHQV